MKTTTIPGFCTLCRSRCGTLNHVRDGKLIAVEALPSHPTGRATCAKGRAAPELVDHPERILYPLKRTNPKGDPNPGWQRISWEEALDEVAARLNDIRTRGAERVAFAVTTPSGTPMSDSIDWVERFIRSYGSPNTIYGTEICNWHKDAAHAFTYGCSTPNADYANARLNILWGHNPSHVWLSQAGELGTGQKNGARLLVIDPRLTPHARQADLWLAPRPGTDGALALALAHQVIVLKRVNSRFVRCWSNAALLVDEASGQLLRDPSQPDNFMAWNHEQCAPISLDTRQPISEMLASQLALEGEYMVPSGGDTFIHCRPAWEHYRQACSKWTPEQAEKETGISADKIVQAAELIIEAGDSISYHGWTGIGQHANATQTERAIATLYALTGSFDRPGSNRRWSTPSVNSVNSLELMPEGQLAKALGSDKRPLGPASSGWVTAEDVYDAIEGKAPYPIEALFCFGSNVLVAQPEAERGQRALSQLGFHVHCDLFHTPTNAYADIILPISTPWEREGLRVGFEINAKAASYVQLRQAMLPPRGESRADYQIALDLGCRLGMEPLFFHGDIEQGWNYILAPSGLDIDTLRRSPEGIQLALLDIPERHAITDSLGHCLGFATPSRRVEFYSQTLAEHGYPAVPQYISPQPTASPKWPLTLTTAKSGYYCHSQQRQLPSLRRRAPNPTLSISPQLAHSRGLVTGSWAAVVTKNGRVRMRVNIDQNLSDDLVVADYGWWQACTDLGLSGYALHGPNSANINSIISTRVRDPISGSLPLRSTPCELEAIDCQGTSWSGFRRMRIIARTQEAEDVVSLWFSPVDGKPLPSYIPGQYATFRFQIGEQHFQRSYSLSAAAPLQDTTDTRYRISVRRNVKKGSVSQYIHSYLHVGKDIEMTIPTGNFTLPLHHQRPLVFIAGGIGITPFISFLETLASHYKNFEAPEITLYYSNRNSLFHAFAQRLDELQRILPRLLVKTIYTNPTPSDIARKRFDYQGHLSQYWQRDAWSRKGPRFYLCGPTRMIEDAQKFLEAQGVQPFEIFHEAFTAPVREKIKDIQPRRIYLTRSERQFTWHPQDGSLLESAEKQGFCLPSGCRVGQCESCAIYLIKGRVHALTDTAVEGKRVLCCQTIPLSDLSLDA